MIGGGAKFPVSPGVRHRTPDSVRAVIPPYLNEAARPRPARRPPPPADTPIRVGRLDDLLTLMSFYATRSPTLWQLWAERALVLDSDYYCTSVGGVIANLGYIKKGGDVAEIVLFMGRVIHLLTCARRRPVPARGARPSHRRPGSSRSGHRPGALAANSASPSARARTPRRVSCFGRHRRDIDSTEAYSG
ncbi:hypothetical protein EVAR_65814_1 [Eumeta japonica]|uniref:Uncharacterized protein n=1 Tax=Eumeta variegata TaxID=151549 RepID=A0A4C1ZJ04_EUMVA|nr:hypothetical protein EVAR_65814_1 [Eumeta japonica]